jgi:ADP-dependent NAD(P)H-hydrate dehydratase / NAD(P)H-hydrate epimerase
MKFFSTNQIKQLDQYTIEHEPISSIDLMERAADALYWEFVGQFPYLQTICVLAGSGNNGGDALAMARMLLQLGYPVSAYLLHTGGLSDDCEINRKRLLERFPRALTELENEFIAPSICEDSILLDGLFGSGLSRPLSGIHAQAVEWMNSSGCKVVAIDIPSGLHGEENTIEDSSIIVRADYTLSIQFPKLSFLLPENAKYVGNWRTVAIGLHPKAIKMTESNLFYLEQNDILPLLKERNKFSHKGTFGHACIAAGSLDMAGAAVLSAKAALRSGAGLVTVHSAAANRIIVQSAVPEAIFQSDKADNFITEIETLETYNAVAIGPGIGKKAETVEMLHHFLKNYNKPCILDADALNIISQNKELLPLIPKNSIITPHPKEFERLFGKCNSGYERMKKASVYAQELQIIIILKGANTLIATPNGKLYFNSTGNSGMATAGAGDVLTGMLAGLMAQAYAPEDAAKVGVYLHGLTGDLSLRQQSAESLIAGDIVENIGKAFNYIRPLHS